jgi:phosphoribosylanthranilate isomerase
LAKVALDLPVILAGGLNSDTVAEAVQQINP